jgi:hypothetical protein
MARHHLRPGQIGYRRQHPLQLSRPGPAGVRRRRAELLSGQRQFGLRAGGHRRAAGRAPEPQPSGAGMASWKCGCRLCRASSIWSRSIRPAAAARATTPRPGAGDGDRPAVRGVCRPCGRPGTGAPGRPAWRRSTTTRGWWWNETTTAAACWRWRRRFAVHAYLPQNGQPGWLTTSVSRPAVLGQLGAALVEQPERFMSRRLLGECRSFVRLPNGRTRERAPGPTTTA